MSDEFADAVARLHELTIGSSKFLGGGAGISAFTAPDSTAHIWLRICH